MAGKRTECSTLFAVLFLATSSFGQGRVDLLIAGGTVVTMDDEYRVVEGGAVAVEGNRIVSVLDRGALFPQAEETLDATGMLVIPGLVNSHGHVPMSLLRGIADDRKLMEWLNDFIFPAEARNVDEEFSYWGTLLSAIEMARSGTTTFIDMYYFEESIAKAVDEAGLRAVLGQTIIGFPAPDFETPEDALRATEALILKWKDHPRIVPSVAPHALYTTDHRGRGESAGALPPLRSPLPVPRPRGGGGGRGGAGEVRGDGGDASRREEPPRSGNDPSPRHYSDRHRYRASREAGSRGLSQPREQHERRLGARARARSPRRAE